MSHFTSVLIAGSTGWIGESITNGFLDAEPKWKVSLLVRPTAENDPKKKAKLDKFIAKGATIVHGVLEKPETYQDKLKGIEVVVSVVSHGGVVEQIELINACKASGVKLFLPSEYGVDYEKASPLSVIFDGQRKVREELKKGGLDYIIVETGLFYEAFVAPHFGTDPGNKKVPLFGERSTKVSTCALTDAASLVPFLVNDPSLYNTKVGLSGEQTTAGYLHDEVKALFGEDAQTLHLKLDELEAKIKSQSNPFASILEQVMLIVVDGSSWNPNAIDGKKYGRPLSSFHDFCQNMKKILSK